MAIKPIESMPSPKINERMERLKNDVREIIEKRIPVCEIIDPPYPQSTMRAQLGKAIRIVVWEQQVGTAKAFKIETRKIDNVVHWYVIFDKAKWDWPDK